VCGIHIAASCLTGSAVSPLRTRGSRFASLRGLRTSHCSISGGVMACGSALVSSRHIRATPLRIRTGALSRLRIGARVRVIRLCCASGAIRSRDSTASCVRACVRIITSSPGR
jgi:hypothetical protein